MGVHLIAASPVDPSSLLCYLWRTQERRPWCMHLLKNIVEVVVAALLGTLVSAVVGVPVVFLCEPEAFLEE